MSFSLHQGEVVKSDNTRTIIKKTLAHILDTYPLILSSCALFVVSQPHHVTASHPSPDDNHRAREGGPKENRDKQKWPHETHSVTYICTRDLHSFLSFVHCRAASTVIPLLPKATFTPFIQPNLGLPRTRPPLTSAITTILAIRYSSILSR